MKKGLNVLPSCLLFKSMTLLLCAWSLVAFSGCGELSDSVGTYQGPLKQTTKTNFGMRTEEVDRVVSFVIDDDGNGLIGLQTDCALSAELDGDALTITKQSCSWSNEAAADTWTYEGSGKVDGETFTLTLDGDFTRTYKDNRAPLEGSYELDYTGARF